MIIAYFRIFILWAVCSLAYAGGPETGVSEPAATSNVHYCPATSTLQKDPMTHTWSAPDGWKSYDMSFTDKLTHFSGAQWRGTNVGQIFCVYRGEIATEFPVLLAYRVLTYEPQGGRWSVNLGGYHNCETPNQEECPFIIRLQQPTEDMYEQAGKLRHPVSHPSHVGF
jgi:hypothetical protein